MFFKRKDGQIDKSVDIFERIMPIIMKERNDALVYIKKDIPLDGMNEYIRRKKEEGIEYTHMEIIFTAFAHLLKEKTKLNRFVMSGEIYNRNTIDISVVVKPRLEEDVKESVAKFTFNGNEKILDVSNMMKKEISNIKNNKDSSVDDLANKFKNIPTFILKLAVNSLIFLDKISTSPLSQANTISCSISIRFNACSIAPIPLKTVATFNFLFNFISSISSILFSKSNLYINSP